MIFLFPEKYFFNVESREDFKIDCLGLQNSSRVDSFKNSENALLMIQSSEIAEKESKIWQEIDEEYANSEISK